MTKNNVLTDSRRAFSVVDLENLCGGSHKVGTYGRMTRNWVSQVTKMMGYCRPSAQVTAVGVNALDQDLHLATYWHDSEFRVGYGLDGADRQLLDVLRTDQRIEKCDELLLFSGDHCFTEQVNRLRKKGITVTAISWNGSMSFELERAATRAFKFELPKYCPIQPNKQSQTWRTPSSTLAHAAA